MTDILIHKSSAYIKEDRDYYCSDIRDKHGMIKPDDNLISVTADSTIFADKVEADKQVSIYYPFKAKSFHRIYLGISYPLLQITGVLPSLDILCILSMMRVQ